MTQPLVSVHVVTYNQRDVIGETLESILTQAYEPLQVVVSDDGSTDGTDAIVSGYASRYKERVVAITGGPNLGISGNSNRCLARCTGKYVAFVAGDDLMLPGKVEAQVRWLEEDEKRVLCAHDVEHFDSSTGRTLRLHSAMANLRSGRGAGDLMRGGYFCATSSIMVRRSAIPSRGFDERIKIHSDWKFAVECLVGGGAFGFVPGILGRYRRHGGNATAKYASLRWEEVHVTIALLEAEYPELASACESARAHAYYQRAVSLLQQGETSESRRAIMNSLRHDPLMSWKVPVWWAVGLTPRGLLPKRIRERLGLQ